MDRADVGALVRSAVDGDTAAWKALVEGLSPLVWSVVRAHRLSDADAHEVYQTVWFRFAQNLGGISEPEGVRTWLASTTRHECLKVLKSVRRLTPTDDPWLLYRVNEDPTSEQSPFDSEQLPFDSEEAAAHAERTRLMREEFEGLGEQCQQLLRLLMASPAPSAQEVSAALGIDVGSIGPLRRRCLRHLRARLRARGVIVGSRSAHAALADGPEPTVPHRDVTPSDRDGSGGGWATSDDHATDAGSAVELTGEFSIEYEPPAWYAQSTRGAWSAPGTSSTPGAPGASSAPGSASAPPPPAGLPTWPAPPEPGAAPLDSGLPEPGATPLDPAQPPADAPPSDIAAGIGDGSMEPRWLVAELPEQTSPGRVVPLHVQIVRADGRGVQLRSFALPPDGARVLVTLHAPGLVAVDDLYQELHVMPGRDSEVQLFRLKAPTAGLHQVTVRAFRSGTFLGEVTCQISVEHGSVTRDGPQHRAPLPSMAFDPGEVTLQVHKDEAAGAFRFQLISETFYAPVILPFRAGDPRPATEQIYAELKRAAQDAATGRGAKNAKNAKRLRDRLRSHGVQLWTSAVPEAVQRQFWDEAEQVKAFTVLGEHDIVPWELLYPLNEGHKDRGFLAEWLPVVRRMINQDRVRSLHLPAVAFVVPPGSPADAEEEVRSLRARLSAGVADVGVLTEQAALTALVEGGHAGLLHFACHNAFTGTGSCVTMADGPFDPIDLASAAQLRSLRTHRPLVFFNACRSAGEIDWFGETLGWAPQFLNAGAGAFVGTLWPVRSRSALQFAEAFYDQLITNRQPLGQASLAARQTIRDLHGGDPTWLAYAVYGSPAATVHTT